MYLFSIVILTKNEEQHIQACLKPLLGLTDDILVVDTGSNDRTIELAEGMGARVLEQTWLGYSNSKNNANSCAKYDWVLSLDADEVVQDELRLEIEQLCSTEITMNTMFSLQRKLVYCGQVLDYGAVSSEFRNRLFNRNFAYWNSNEVHEELQFSEPVQIKKLQGYLLHYSYASNQEHQERLQKYAQLSAQQLHAKGKKATFVKRYGSPIFGFVKNYVFKLGFLDGALGFQFANNEMAYVKRKYELLASMK